MFTQPAPGKAPDTMLDKAPSPPFTQILRLCNFATGSAELLESHKVALLKLIAELSWAGDGGHIDCVGISSKLGFADTSKSNQKLSEQRAWAVKELIERAGRKVAHGFATNVTMGLGDDTSQKDPTGNDGFFRAVDVKFVIQKGGFNPFPKPKPTPPPPVIPIKPNRGFIFQAIQVSSVSQSLKVSGVEVDLMEFAIRDPLNQRTRYYVFVGGAATMPTPDAVDGILKKILSLPIGVSVGRISDKVSFLIRDPITDMAKFQGDGTLVQAAGASFGTVSVGGQVTFRFSPGPVTDATQTIQVVFSTSKGIATPGLGSGGKGFIVMMKPGYRPRTFDGESIL